MLDLAQGGYTADEVLARLRYTDGAREVKYRYDLLDKDGVKIGDLRILSGSVSFSAAAQIKRSAAFEVDERELADVDLVNDRVQPFFMLNMGTRAEPVWLEWPLGVFLISSPRRTQRGKRVTREVQAYDLNLILSQDRFTDRYLIPKGINYTNAVKVILAGAGITKSSVISSPATLSADREYEIGESKITAVDDLLRAVNYTSLYMDGDGSATAKPYIPPGDRLPDHGYRDGEASVLSNEFDNALDIFEIPNYFVRTVVNSETDEVLRAEYINSNPSSSLSTVRRGRSVVDYEELSGSDIADLTTLQAYVYRLASERTQAYESVSFTTAAMPHHGYSDHIFLVNEEMNISAQYAETNWSLDLGNGGRMRHDARKVVYL